MFFHAPPPYTLYVSDISTSLHSSDMSKTDQQSDALSENDISISLHTSTISETSESYDDLIDDSPPPTQIKQTYLSENTKKIPLTSANLKKHNELMNKKEFEKKYKKIKNITDKKIIDDFNTPITIKNLVDFTKYFVNKKNLPKNKKNKMVFSIFKNIMPIKESPLNFNKKELISAYIYMDRIYNEFDDFKYLTELYTNNNTHSISYKYCKRLTLILALIKTMAVYDKDKLVQNYVKNKFTNIYDKIDEQIGDDISYEEYQWYSKNFFD